MKPTLDRARYLLDRMIARGPRMLLLLHFVVSAVVLAVTALVAWRFTLYDSHDRGLAWTLWFNTVLTLDPGTATNIKGEQGHQLAAAVVVAVLGLVIVGSLIALLQNAVQYRVEQMRKGTSRVIESGHVVIVGWSRQTFLVVRNLLDERPGVPIAILADRGRVEMEDELRARFRRPATRRALRHPDARFSAAELRRISCRTGNPIEPEALHIVSPETASSIIVVSPEVAHADAHVVKILLALSQDLKTTEQQVPVVAQILHSKNLGVAKAAAGPTAHIVATSGVVARALVQACRQSGFASIIDDLLREGDNDLRFVPDDRAVGMPFGEILNRYSDASVIGVYARPEPESSVRNERTSVMLNPSPGTLISSHHELIMISKGAGERIAAFGEPIDESVIAPRDGRPAEPEHTLILGFSHKMRRIVRELRAYCPPGSRIRIVADSRHAQVPTLGATEAARAIVVELERADPTDRHVLDGLDLTSYNHVIVVSCCDDYEAQYADARTIMTLLHLRELVVARHADLTIAAEILDTSNRSLATFVDVAGATIIDDEFVARMLTRIASDWKLHAVIDDLFDSRGSEIYFKPASEYVVEGRSVKFATVVEAARRRSEIAIGVQKVGGAPKLNPAKTDPFTFDKNDRVIVLAES